MLDYLYKSGRCTCGIKSAQIALQSEIGCSGGIQRAAEQNSFVPSPRYFDLSHCARLRDPRSEDEIVTTATAKVVFSSDYHEKCTKGLVSVLS